MITLPHQPPPGACDAHAHIFGPPERFPFVLRVPYEPPRAPVEAYLAMLDTLGFARGVLVTPVTYQFDNRSVIDACRRAPDRIRGVGVLGVDATDATLDELRAANVKGLRFSEMSADEGGRYGAASLETFHQLAPRMKDFALHAQTWTPAGRFAAEAEALLAHGVPIVIDHLTRPDVARGVTDAAFQKIVRLVAEGRVWVKIALPRVGTHARDYQDARPFHDAMIKANPERLVWGSDWPHVRQEPVPDTGHLYDLFDEWIDGDAELKRKILVDNPARLYGF